MQLNPNSVRPITLSRGDVILDSDLPGFIREPVVVLSAVKVSGGGIGMGEYPARLFLTLSDGRHLVYDEWSHNPSHPAMFTISGKATFAKDGRLVLFNG